MSYTLYIVWSNKDLTEGRFKDFPMAICREQVTAERLAKHNYVQGSDCPITSVQVHTSANGISYIPISAVDVIGPSIEDVALIKKMEEEHILMQSKRKLIEKALELGMTKEELMVLGTVNIMQL